MSKVPTLTELLQAGAHFGHRTSKWHPKMKKYLFGSRQGIHIINLEETQQALESAQAFVKSVCQHGGTVLFIGTKKQASDIVRSAAESCGMPYVNKRWLGGTFTNFPVIAQLIRKFKDLKKKQERGELAKYTKFEQQKFSEEIEKLDEKIGGIQELTRVPDAIFLLDIRKDNTALDEAVRRGIKVVAICDSNVNPTSVDYPIPANDDAVKALELIATRIASACRDGRDEWEKARARLGGSLVNAHREPTKQVVS